MKRRPFRAMATGSDVFVGPQTATVMAGLKKALASQDAVIAVTGPAGTGKSTLVTRGLEALAKTHRVIGIGRMQLDTEAVLDFLLEELGTEALPGGTIRKFTRLRECLAKLERENLRVVIVLEDAAKLGADTLAEIEALTAAEAGPSAGAAIVLMGDDRLGKTLEDVQLARLVQRIRQRLPVKALSAAELRGYLLHCFRLAGNEFETIFDDRCAALLHHLSHGIPRVANNLADSAMAAAAARGEDRVTAERLAGVARDEFGLHATTFDFAAAALRREPLPDARQEPEELPEQEPQPEPVLVFSDDENGPLLTDDEIPDLIQDTLPELEAMATETPVAAAVPAAENRPEPVPELSIAADRDPAESAAEDVPDWERDPTIAELRPDLDALEAAMALVESEASDGPLPPEPAVAAAADPQPADDSFEDIPEITLDDAIQQRIEDNLIDEPGQVGPVASEPPDAPSDDGDLPELETPAGSSRKADDELAKIAVELAKAKTIEDVDDKLAETLFGEELSLTAAQVVTGSPGAVSANDEIQVGAVEAASAVPGGAVEVPQQEAPRPNSDGGTDRSASQRLQTVQALNSDRQPAAPPPAPKAETPDPIEDQINTSMTQTLKALNVRPPISDRTRRHDVDDEDEDRKGGFFSRFKRS